MALKLITSAVKAMAKGGVAGGAAGAAGKAADDFLGGNEELEIKSIGEEVQQEESNVVSRSPVIPLETTEAPETIYNFANNIVKNTEIIEKVVDAPKIKPQDESVQGFKRLVQKEKELEQQRQVATAVSGIRSAGMVLQEDAKDAIEKQRREKLKSEREAEEQKLEGGLGDMATTGFEKVAGFAGRAKDGILAALSPFMTPALLFGGSFLAEKIEEILPERFRDTDLETVLNTVDMAADKVASLSATVGLRSLAGKVGKAGQITLQNMGLAKPPPAVAQPGVNAAQATVGKVGAGGKYQRFLAKLASARKWFIGLQKASNSIVASASQWMAKLPAKAMQFLKRTMRKVLKWYLIFEAISAMYNATQALILGTISEDEWHTRNKEQITKIIRLFGGPFLVMALFAAAGTVVPVLGNLAGGLGGLIVGILLGDSVFNILKLNVIVEGMYDVFFLGSWDKLKSYIPTLLSSVGSRLNEIIADAAKSAFEAVTTSPLRIANEMFSDRMATEEEISAEYGDDVRGTELLFKAGEGLGTDENAVLYAFKDIDTPEKYNAFKNEFEEKFIPEYNEGFGRDVETMEEYLQKELGTDSYDQLKNQVAVQMRENAENESEKLRDFLRETGIDESTVIAGVGAVSDEDFSRYQSGELIDVTTQDGERVLMTEEQLLNSDNVGVAARESALERIERNRRIFTVRQTQEEETPNDVNESVAEQPERPTEGSQDQPSPIQSQKAVANTNENIQQNIIPAVSGMNNSINLVNQNLINQKQRKSPPGGTEGPSTPSSANPSRKTTDNFVEVGYVT